MDGNARTPKRDANAFCLVESTEATYTVPASRDATVRHVGSSCLQWVHLWVCVGVGVGVSRRGGGVGKRTRKKQTINAPGRHHRHQPLAAGLRCELVKVVILGGRGQGREVVSFLRPRIALHPSTFLLFSLTVNTTTSPAGLMGALSSSAPASSEAAAAARRQRRRRARRIGNDVEKKNVKECFPMRECRPLTDRPTFFFPSQHQATNKAKRQNRQHKQKTPTMKKYTQTVRPRCVASLHLLTRPPPAAPPPPQSGPAASSGAPAAAPPSETRPPAPPTRAPSRRRRHRPTGCTRAPPLR